MSPRASRAGSRQGKYRYMNGFGRFAENKLGILVTSITRQLAIQALDPNAWDEENDVKLKSEAGDNIVLIMPVPGRTKPLIWNMSAMTTEELEATRKFFNYLFDLADPIVRERDKVALDAHKSGDDSYIRVYRTLPQFIARSRKVDSDSEGVHE
jgi:hypothetical protein